MKLPELPESAALKTHLATCRHCGGRAWSMPCREGWRLARLVAAARQGQAGRPGDRP